MEALLSLLLRSWYLQSSVLEMGDGLSAQLDEMEGCINQPGR